MSDLNLVSSAALWLEETFLTEDSVKYLTGDDAIEALERVKHIQEYCQKVALKHERKELIKEVVYEMMDDIRDNSDPGLVISITDLESEQYSWLENRLHEEDIA